MFGRHNKETQKAARSIVYTADENAGAAISPAKIEEQGGVSLRKKSEAVGVSLKKKGLTGIRAQVVVLLDHSGSMYSDYASHKVQDLVERFLGFALSIDVDGEVPVVPFDTRVHNETVVTMANYSNIVDAQIWKKNGMGTTNLTDALHKVRDMANKTDAPLFVAIITDGEPDERSSAKQLVIDLARYPVFIKFLAVRPVRFLEELDDLGNDERLLDNVDTKEYMDLATVTDEQFAEDMVDEWDSWITAATTAEILVKG